MLPMMDTKTGPHVQAKFSIKSLLSHFHGHTMPSFQLGNQFFFSFLPHSSARRNFFVSRPPAKPVSSPEEPITRWHGTITEMGFLPMAAPTARTAFTLPIFLAIAA